MTGLKSKKRSKKPKELDTEEFDPRFAAALNRPQFSKVKEQTNKVVLDDRFASVLTDPRFQLQENNKYGLKKKKRDAKLATNELTAFYTVDKKEPNDTSDRSDNDESSAEENEEQDEQESESSDEDEDPASRIAYLTALSRGELDVSSSSEDDESVEADTEEDSVHEEVLLNEKAGILDPSRKSEDEVEITYVPSPFMAVMNMDWSHVRAVDIFAIMSSFTPPGSIKKVQIYPSNFGIEQMAKEATQGPIDIWKHETSPPDDEDEDDDDDESSESERSDNVEPAIKMEVDVGAVDSDFDPEKLRAYEASKLKYYFAIVEFATPELATIAYKEVDGLELEHSSAAVDLRSIDPDQLSDIIAGKKMRDEAKSIPSKYDPPEFVVGALQQTNVNCTWEDGDMERQRKLTRYDQQQDWSAMAEGEDLRAYLASDNSSVGSGEESSDEEAVKKGGEKKGSKMRKMLGLESDEDNDDNNDSSSEEGASKHFDKVATFTPGKKELEEKIRSKLEPQEVELTPWEKYQEKRKQKRREKRQSARSKRGDKNDSVEDDGMYDDDPAFVHEGFVDDEEAADDANFLVDEDKTSNTKRHKSKKEKGKNKGKPELTTDAAPSTKAELELLLAGDNDEEATKDYDMRGIIRMDKNKGKKLSGARKRKEASLAANTSGGDFKIDTTDTRFAAVLQGSDGRFGIDRTDANYKDTEAMRKILSEQTKQRKESRKKAKVSEVVINVSADSSQVNSSSGASALSSLVKSLKANVAKKSQ